MPRDSGQHERPIARDAFFASLAGRSWVVFGAVVFCMFAPLWAVMTARMVQPGRLGAFAIWCVFAGLVAVLYFLTFTRSRRFLPAAIAASVAIGFGGWWFESRVAQGGWFGPGIGAPIPSPEGLISVALIIAAYVLLSIFLGTVGASHVRMRTEMDVARRIHAELVPGVDLERDGTRIVGRSEASGEMGGDLLDVLERGDAIDVFVGDVTGHGVRAGTVMAVAKGAAHALVRAGDRDLGAIMGELNRVLCDLTAPDMFLTMIALRVRGSTLEYASAGHPPGLVFRAGGALETLVPQSLPLGVDPDESFETSRLHLDPRDRVLLVTDGLAETADLRGSMLGGAGIEAIARSHAGRDPAAMIDAVLADVRAHGPQIDDQTLAVIERVGVGA